jgi:xylulose-5-phosphate/fructose-6-phosphate phosphoketolase
MVCAANKSGSPPDGLFYRRRGYKEQGNIDTPLELAIQNRADRFSLAIDRTPRFRVPGSSAREALLNQQIACKNRAEEFGVDAPDIVNWQWPF